MTHHELSDQLQEMPEPYAAMGVGIPGSGKTTALEKVSNRLDVVRICPDDIREELTGSAANQSVNARAWEEAYARAQTALEAGQSIIMDATHAEAWRRPKAVEFYRACGAAAVAAVAFNASLETAAQRNAARQRIVPDYAMERMHTALQQEPPTIEEGFDAIIRIDTEDST